MEEKKITSKFAWKVYNFINAYKSGDFGLVPLQEAIDKYFNDWNAQDAPKCQIGDV